MKHFIYINPAAARKFFNADMKEGRVPVSNNLLWTLFLGAGEENFKRIKSALRGRTPLHVLDSVVSIYMFEHNDDYHVRMHNCCSTSLGYYFKTIGLSDLDTFVNSLFYIISYDD